MANEEHIKILKQGVEVWNKWRKENPDIRPDLYQADLSEANLDSLNHSGAVFRQPNLRKFDLHKANLRAANLFEADLSKAVINKADLCGANLCSANLFEAKLIGANLKEANLKESDLRKANLREAKLHKANLHKADLCQTRLFGAKLIQADLSEANLNKAKLNKADLGGADLSRTILVETNFTKANLTNSIVYGISAWDLVLDNATQTGFIITKKGEPAISVDNLEVAQFIYLLLKNEKIRDVIDTIGKKGVLILGRFTDKRKAILHAIRDELRNRYGLLPIMFEFDPLSTEPTIKTLSTLAHLSRFVIADLTDAKSVLQELTKILHDIPTLPVKPIIHKSGELPPMSDGFLVMKSMLKPPYVYSTKKKLLADLKEEVIDPAEECVKKFEAELVEIRQKWLSWQ